VDIGSGHLISEAPARLGRRIAKLMPGDPNYSVFGVSGGEAVDLAIKGRGYLKNGYAADVTVFDYNRVRDSNTVEVTDNKPSGIEQVFINGVHVLKRCRVDGTPRPGRIYIGSNSSCGPAGR
jgi:N-acyl-D-aspartate/D-glutamate deacylase